MLAQRLREFGRLILAAEFCDTAGFSGSAPQVRGNTDSCKIAGTVSDIANEIYELFGVLRGLARRLNLGEAYRALSRPLGLVSFDRRSA
jgi:hypothetical protein